MLCGAALGLLLLLGRWWGLRAEGEALRREIRRSRAEVAELEPTIQQVREEKARHRRLESRVVDLGERAKLHQATDAVLTALGPDILLERLEVRGLEVRILARADDDRAVQRFVETLREGGGFDAIRRGDEPPAEAPAAPRFVVRGELDVPWPGAEE